MKPHTLIIIRCIRPNCLRLRAEGFLRWHLRVIVATGCLLTSICLAQSLDQRLDEDQYLRGLIELNLPELLNEYIAAHPPADQTQAASFEIAKRRMLLNDTSRSATERRATIDEILAIRRRLIADHPADDRRAIWLADQATDLLFDALGADALGLTVLFGRPTASQREQAADMIQEMHEAAIQAEIAMDALLRSIETAPGFADDPALRQRRAALVQRERDRRIPFLRGVGAVLRAEVMPMGEAERNDLYRQAAQDLPALADLLDGAPSLMARLYGGLALARLGEFDRAESLFAQVATDPIATPADTFAARMAGVLNRTIADGPQSGLNALASIEPRYAGDDPANLFYRVLIADRRFQLRRELALNAPAEQRDGLLAQAFDAYTSMLNSNASGDRDALHAIVMSRLADAAGDDAPLDKLPPIVAVARAERLARDAATREQAIIMLERQLQSTRLSEPERATTLFTLAKALHAHGQRHFAAERFFELAERHAADSHAERAAQAGAVIAEQLYRATPHDSIVRQLLRDGLNVVLSKYPNLPTVDRWRFIAGELALSDGRFAEAAALFKQIAPDSEVWPDAHFMQAAVARAQATSAVDPAERIALSQEAIKVIQRIRSAIQTLAQQPRDERTAAAMARHLGLLRVYEAEALLHMNLPTRAIELLEGIENDPSLSGQVIGEALRTRISAYQALKRPEDAVADIRRFVDAAPEQAAAVLAPMLEGLLGEVRELIQRDQTDAAEELAQRAVLPIAAFLYEHVQSRGSDEDARRFAPLLAEGFRHGGRYDDALRWYERLLQTQPDALALLVGQAECLFHLGGEARLARAIELYKRIAAAGEQAAGESYWLAQLRMLEILDRVNRNTQQIVPRIERLRQQDANFGGERFRRRFEALRNKHA